MRSRVVPGSRSGAELSTSNRTDRKTSTLAGTWGTCPPLRRPAKRSAAPDLRNSRLPRRYLWRQHAILTQWPCWPGCLSLPRPCFRRCWFLTLRHSGLQACTTKPLCAPWRPFCSEGRRGVLPSSTKLLSRSTLLASGSTACQAKPSGVADPDSRFWKYCAWRRRHRPGQPASRRQRKVSPSMRDSASAGHQRELLPASVTLAGLRDCHAGAAAPQYVQRRLGMRRRLRCKRRSLGSPSVADEHGDWLVCGAVTTSWCWANHPWSIVC